ncbi:MAG: ATP-grasp domain-containing protein [Oscillospiraceae bacterium]|nr:ATP-grasp domain-containing protein [Oscillospiraceae bacterium]
MKPNAEGSSKGISSDSVVYDRIQLEAMLMSRFKQKETLLVEEFIEGREFTVGILGNGKDIKVFEPMEIVFKDKNHSVYGYDIKQNFQEYIEYTVTSKIPHAVIRELSDMAGKAFKLFGCKDMARVDFRVNEFNEVYFIEINPLPGLAPGYSDFPMIAEFSGIGYTSLIVQILKTAMMRYSLNSYIALSCEAEGGNK